MNRRTARSLLVLTIVVLALTASACGSDDPVQRQLVPLPADGPRHHEPANAGWWSITAGQGAKTSYGVDIDGISRTSATAP